MQNAVIYARYSSHNQRDVSIDQQVKACRKYAKENSLSVIRVYADHAMTGTNDQRPEFQHMIRDSASRAFQYVIVYSLDRFSRDRYDSAIYKHTLKEHGVRVLSAVENIQDNPTGILMESILEGFAEYYSKELAQKIRRGMISNAEKCMVISPLPLGYIKSPDGLYQLVPEEAAVVVQIFQRVASGESLSAIAADLNSRGIRSKRGHAWTASSFNSMLHNECYIGIYHYADIRIEHGVPAIVDPRLFAAVQARLQTKQNPRQNPKRRVRETGTYLLTGKLYCGHCKAPMVGVSGTGKHGDLHFYYACKTHRKSSAACHKSPVPRAPVEEAIASTLQAMIASPDVSAWLADKVIEYLQQSQESEEIKLLTAQLATVTKEKENTLRAIRQGVIAASVQQMLTDLESQESALAAKLALARDRLQSDITREDVLAFLEMLRDGDVHDKQYQAQLIDAFLVRAYLYDDQIKLVTSFTGTSPGDISIPFDIDTAESASTDRLDLSGVRISPPEVHLTHLIRTRYLYMVAGLFVMVMKFTGKNR